MKNAADTRPGNGRVTIKPIPNEDVSPIINPDKDKERPQHGIVVVVGKRKFPEDAFVEEGDKVVYGKYAGVEIIYADGPHIVMMETDIISTI